MIKAGILFPRSGIYPLMGSDLIAGIRAFINSHSLQQEIELILEPVGFGADKKEVFQKTEQLFLVQNVDIIVAYLDMRVADILYPLAEALQKPLIVVNPGANYPSNWVAPDNILFLDLKDILHCRLSGKAAGEHSDNKAVMAISYYDGGYHHGHSMLTPFLENGGEILFNYISPLKKADFTIAPLSQYLREHPASTQILAVFSGEESNQFLRELSLISMAKPLTIFCSPFMLEEQTLQQMEFPLNMELKGFFSWHKDIDCKENHDFKVHIKRDSKREANVFSLLGWESGMLLKEYNELTAEDQHGTVLVTRLGNKTLNSPRGGLILDPISHHLLGPEYECTINNNGKQVSLSSDLKHTLKEWEQLMAQSLKGESSGWTNTYLCS